MGSYRGRLDIIADILQVVENGDAKKTRVMYQANLSYKLLKRYLDEITEAGLGQFDEVDGRYSISDKGRKFLEEYGRYAWWNRRVGKWLDELEKDRRVLEKLSSSEYV